MASPSSPTHSPFLLKSSEPAEQAAAVATVTKRDRREFNFFKTDPKSIWSQIKRQDKHIKLKRRWLIGLQLTKSEKTKLNKSNFFQNSFLSESLLREDDIFYESVRARVEGALGGHGVESVNRVSQDDMHSIDIPNVKLKRLISSCLNNLTNKGLYNLAMILHGGSIKSELTRCNLKKIIKGSFSSVLGRKRHDPDQVETRKKLFELLNNPQHFRDRCGPLSALISQSDHAAVKKVLHGLKSLPTQTLIAMNRKLRGKVAPIPQLQPSRSGWGRNRLINLVKELVREMLSQLDSGNELQEPLAKAMAVSDLSKKLMAGCHSKFSKEFYQFSPEVKSLQNDIMNAIWSVRKKVVTLPVLRNLQLLIEPEAVIPTRCLRTTFVHFLTEFLFQCSDMDRVPKSLTKILDSINRGSNSTHDMLFQKKNIEEEVDRILSVSAQTRQIVLDLLPGHEFDQDFTDAYMEQLEESEDSGSDEDDDVDNQLQEYKYRQCKNEISNSMDSDHEAESIGDFVPFQSHPFTSMTQENVSFYSDTTSGKKLNSGHEKLRPKNHDTVYLAAEVHNTLHNMNTNNYQEESKQHFSTYTASENLTTITVSPDGESDEKVVKKLDFNDSDTKLGLRNATNLFCHGTKLIPTKDSVCKNQYLAVQDSCDQTSMLAYNMLEEFATNEDLDLNLSSSSYVRSINQVEDEEETKKRASSGKHSRGSTIVQVIKELIPLFPDSGMERLKKLLGS